MSSHNPTIMDDGTVIYLNDKNEWHREDGPATIWPSGNKEWYLNDVLHREDGPAIEWTDGYKEWHLYGKGYNFNDWLRLIPIDEEQKFMLKLIYS